MHERDVIEVLQYFSRIEEILINIKENIRTLTTNANIINGNILDIEIFLKTGEERRPKQ